MRKKNELKLKIQELDPSYEFIESFDNIDDEISFYEEVYRNY